MKLSQKKQNSKFSEELKKEKILLMLVIQLVLNNIKYKCGLNRGM